LAILSTSISCAIALGAARALCYSTFDCCTPPVATLWAVPSCLIAASRGIVQWSALVLFVLPGFGNVRSHSSQTVAFAHFDSSTIWTAMPLCSGCYLCIPVMRIISCSLRANPSIKFVAMWLDTDIVKMLIFVIVPFLPQPWRQQAEMWPLLLGKAAPCWLAVGSHSLACSICALTQSGSHD